MILNPDQKQTLDELVHHPSKLIGRRAALILLAADGLPTIEISKQVGLSRRQVRYWKQQFMERGMEIFTRGESPDAEEIATPEVPPSQPAETVLESHPEQLESAPAVEVAHQKVKKKRRKKKAATELEASEQPPVPELPMPQPIERPGVLAEDSLAEAGRKTLLYLFAEMLRHEDGTRLGEDIEALHDMRVATRRMRAAFDVFADAFDPKVLKVHLKGLRQTGRTLGRVRDLDVILEKANHYLDTLAEQTRLGLSPLIGSWKAERDSAREEMLIYLNGRAYADFKRRFNQFVQTPGEGASMGQDWPPLPQLVREVVPVQIYTRLANVRAFDAILHCASVKQLHALRIEFKKLRYTMEYFREVLGNETKKVIDELKRMQDHLGDLNDAEVACQMLNDFLQTWEARQIDLPLDQRQNPEPVVGYLAYRHAERYRLIVSFPSLWERFNRPELRLYIAQAVASL
ncbi:MAG: CHAD domain-containing protein [Anaerolineales bacterium]|nr:CHAD domain-containing protein [Anaerolineales bacterium]